MAAMRCSRVVNFMIAHAFLTGWHLFTFFTVAPFLCTPSVILNFCFILVTSNTVIWASLFGAQRFKLEVEDFVFHVVVFSRETYQTHFARSNSYAKFVPFEFRNNRLSIKTRTRQLHKQNIFHLQVTENFQTRTESEWKS